MHPLAFGTRTNNMSCGFYLLDTDDLLYFFAYGPGDFSTGLTPVVGQWYHMAFTYDGTTVIVYQDGDPIASSVLALDTDGYRFRIGNEQDLSKELNGQIARMMVHNVALTRDEINKIIHGPVPYQV